MPNPLSEWFSGLHDRMAQDFKKVRFGSEMEAQSGGSSATFRASDSPEYVSQIMSEAPVSFVNRYPDQVNALRELHGLSAMPNGDDDSYFPDIGKGIEALQQQNVVPSTSLLPSFSDFDAFVQSKAVNIGIFVLAAILILGGLVVLALSTDTGKAVVKKGAEVAAA